MDAPITQMLDKIQKKLEEKRGHRLSPNQLLARYQERMQRAEKVRQKQTIEKQQMFEKVRSRQDQAKETKEKLLQDLENKRKKLQYKLQVAKERNERQKLNVQQRANTQNQRFEDTNFMNKLTKQNLQLDLEMKMNETEERRRQILERKVSMLKQQHIAGDHKRKEMSEETRSKLQMQTQKQLLAQQRREEKFLIEKQKANLGLSKRMQVKTRKNYFRRKISDILTFVNSSEQLWDQIQLESDWQALGVSLDIALLNKDGFEQEQADNILGLIRKDSIQLQKLMLVRDYEILNSCISFDSNDKMCIKFNPKPFIKQTDMQGSSSSSLGDSDSEIENELGNTLKQNELTQNFVVSETINPTENLKKQQVDYFGAKLHNQRIKMAMRRNILRKTHSEDLYWAQCLKYDANLLNEPFMQGRPNDLNGKKGNKMRTRSQEQTPERKTQVDKDFLSDFGDNLSEDEGDKDAPVAIKNKSRKNHKNFRGKADRKSVVYQTQTNSILAKDIQTKKLQKNDSQGSFTSNGGKIGQEKVQIGLLNQQSLEQLGPVVKMTLSGYPFSFPQLSTSYSELETQNGSLNTPSQQLQSTSSNFQMNQLIMNQKPLPPSKFYASNLSKAAAQYLFPICDQKLLLMFPSDRQFAQARISVFIQEITSTVSAADCAFEIVEPTSPKTGQEITIKSNNSSPVKQQVTPRPSQELLLTQETIAKCLYQDSIISLKVNESQKSLLFECPEAEKILRLLEKEEVAFKYCRLCDLVCEESHFVTKQHQKRRDDLQVKESEDSNLSQIVFQSSPGDITPELQIEKEKALKRKVKRIKQQIIAQAVSHENASTYPGKELTSANKKRLQIRSIELEKSIFPIIQNYEVVDAILSDIIKVLEKKNQGDLQLMRKLKLIPALIEICKRIQTSHKNEIKQLGKLLSLVIKIIATFSSTRENRNYMYHTNRLMPLHELFLWCLNRTTQVFYSIDFLPSLFQILTQHLRHRVPYECQAMKECFVDLLISSTVTQKLKQKHSIIRQIPQQELHETLGTNVPHILLKSITFLEALNAELSIDARTRPIYEKSTKIGEHVLFVIENTDLFGIVQMITTLLLTFNEPYKVSAQTQGQLQLLPQTIMSLAIMSMKLLNNIIRMEYKIIQKILLKDGSDHIYHLLHFLLSYSDANIDKEEATEDVKEILNETLLFIGYYCLLNEDSQNILQNGQNSILQKLCNLPFVYFMDKRNKDILYPTLIAATYLNKRSLAILHQEIDLIVLEKFIEQNMQIELSQIQEDQREYQSDNTQSITNRSPSINSQGSGSALSVQMDFLNGNNPYIPFVMRFPRSLWKEAIKFLRSD